MQEENSEAETPSSISSLPHPDRADCSGNATHDLHPIGQDRVAKEYVCVCVCENVWCLDTDHEMH